ncbi:hypothetical protein BMW23_0355 [Bodo saltans virus]|uniref:Uncharacterized protein n=1 Tax=Bodo saltans virus TaxID=2024608 RepID=A0A2H4UTZ6_9VIRU|nr:hypothetical protein QJ851_gp0347 [Bodo saltans virus]ATZ80410.1 hypothetical protein BMW23_0355 [Bodo saltans virus]
MLDDLNITSSSQNTKNIKPEIHNTNEPRNELDDKKIKEFVKDEVDKKIKKEYKESDMMLKYDSVDGKFLLYDRYKTFVGYVTVLQLIKYITNDISKSFLKLCDFESSIAVINKFFLVHDSNKIILISHLNSPIMGNLDIVFKLYSGVNNFIVNNLQQELSKFETDDTIKNNIKKKIDEFVYLLLNHSLKLLVLLSEISKQNNSNNSIKESLLKNSIVVMNKLNFIIKSEIDNKILQSQSFNQQLKDLESIKLETNKKLDTLETTIKSQEEKINKILDFIQIRDNDFNKVYNKGNEFLTKQIESDHKLKSPDFSQNITSNKPENPVYITPTNKPENPVYITPTTNINVPLLKLDNINFRDSDFGYEESGKHAPGKNNIGYLTP